MKRAPLKKKSKASLSAIQRELWQECRRIQGDRLANKDGSVDCYTCGARNLQGSNRQLGHGPWPKASLGAFLKYDLRVLRWQCMRCNQFMGGMGAEFYKRILNEIGEEEVRKLETDKNISVKAIDHYQQLLEKYRNE